MHIHLGVTKGIRMGRMGVYAWQPMFLVFIKGTYAAVYACESMILAYIKISHVALYVWQQMLLV